MTKNREMEIGARAVAEDFLFPGDRRKSIAKLVRDNLTWFDCAEARGMFVDDILQILTKAGATYADGTAINFSTLSNALWRVRGMSAIDDEPDNRLQSGIKLALSIPQRLLVSKRERQRKQKQSKPRIHLEKTQN